MLSYALCWLGTKARLSNLYISHSELAGLSWLVGWDFIVNFNINIMSATFLISCDEFCMRVYMLHLVIHTPCLVLVSYWIYFVCSVQLVQFQILPLLSSSILKPVKMFQRETTSVPMYSASAEWFCP